MKKIYFLISVLIMTLLGCSKANQTTIGPNQTTGIGSGGVIYPHSANFLQEHGPAYINNKNQCIGCHAPANILTNPKLSCNGCHINFPHLQNWSLKTEHGTAYAKNPKDCSTCHAADWNGGNSKVSCKTCHNFPHPADWSAKVNHGATYNQAADKAVCLNCHSPANIVTNPKLDCNRCHSVYPHTPTWKANTQHGTAYLKAPQTCEACHGVDGSGGTSGVNCKTCHNFPHSANWSAKANHGATYNLAPDKAVCLNCHTPANAIAYPKTNCYSCHAGFPHTPTWATKAEHGVTYLNNKQACVNCHGIDGSGGTSGVNCKTCHEYPHNSTWGAAVNHGVTYAKAVNKSTCFNCHNPAWPVAGQPAPIETKCQSCHAVFPHPSAADWITNDNSAYHHKKYANSPTGLCLACHRNYVDNMPKYGASGGCRSCHGSKFVLVDNSSPASFNNRVIASSMINARRPEERMCLMEIAQRTPSSVLPDFFNLNRIF